MDRKMANEFASDKILQLLKEQGVNHLYTQARGDQLILYSLEDEEKINRVRFTRLSVNKYQLSIANHRGRWEQTPFTGTIPELVELLIEQLSFVLAEY
jgi:hypothetical protein